MTSDPSVVKSSRPTALDRLDMPQDGQGAIPLPMKASPPPRARKLTLLKKLERYITAIFKLGRTEWTAKQALRQGQALETRVAQVEERSAAQVGQIKQQMMADMADQVTALSQQLKEQAATQASGQALLTGAITDLNLRLDRLMLYTERAEGPPPLHQADVTRQERLETFKDRFYHALENQYRGSRAEITRRLRIYLPDIQKVAQHTGDKPVLDLGCGRGEWLEVLREEGLSAWGVDLNTTQIAEAQALGLDARAGDAIKTLRQAEDASLSAITAHHLIEHLPFDSVALITQEAQRVLAPGGLLLFETPNTRNVLVGATTFYTDPTHLKPMPEQVMGVLLETAGFDPVEIRHLNPHERLEEFAAKADMNEELAFLLFGPQDLAILGQKPLLEG